jgi:hypothetical protein
MSPQAKIIPTAPVTMQRNRSSGGPDCAHGMPCTKTRTAGTIDRFTWFAHETAHIRRPVAFIGERSSWSGPQPDRCSYSHLAARVNTGTTIVTFLMVFLIQTPRPRYHDAAALAELIIAVRGAHNQVAAAEDLSDADLEALHAAYHKRATETLESLKRRRGTHASG